MPWADPHQLKRIEDKLDRLFEQGQDVVLTVHRIEQHGRTTIMPAIDDLKTGLADLGASIDAEITELQQILDKLVAAQNASNDPAIIEATASIKAMKDRLTASKAASDAAFPDDPAPTP